MGWGIIIVVEYGWSFKGAHVVKVHFSAFFNKIVDKEIFKNDKAQIRQMKDFPYTTTFGKVIKKPEEMSDVRALVTADYQELKEQEWLEELKNRYPVVINEDVLNTIK